MLLSTNTIPPVGIVHGATDTVRSLFENSNTPDSKIEAIVGNENSVFGYGSGKSALTIALKALGKIRSDKNEVVVPAYTCFSVAAAIEQAGLKIVLCDLDPHSLGFNLDQLNNVVNDKTLCVVPTWLFGLKGDVEKINETVKRYNSFTILDSAQYLGMPDSLKATVADVSLFSFGRGKPLSVLHGGILTTRNPEVVNAIQTVSSAYPQQSRIADIKMAINILINDTLIRPGLYWLPASIPALGIGKTVYPQHIDIKNMGRLQKSLLAKKLTKLQTITNIRKTNAEFYVKQLAQVPNIELIHGSKSSDYAPVRFPIYIKKSIAELTDKHRKHAVTLGIVPMYPTGLNKLTNISKFWLNQTVEFEGADWISKHLLTLPTHQWVSQNIREKIKEFLEDISR